MLLSITILLVLFLIFGIIITIYFFGVIPNTEPYFTKQVEDTIYKISTTTKCEDIFDVIDGIKTKIRDNKTFREWIRYGVSVNDIIVIDQDNDDEYVGLPVSRDLINIVKEKVSKCIKDSKVIEYCEKCKKCREDYDNDEDVKKHCGEYCSECKLDSIKIKKPNDGQVKKDICETCRRCKNRGYSEKTCKAMCADCNARKEKEAEEAEKAKAEAEKENESFANYKLNPYYQVNM